MKTAIVLLLLSTVLAQDNWVDQLTNQNGYRCCTNEDGERLGPVSWDTNAADGFPYKVLHNDGEWYRVPQDAVVRERNRDGIARVWYGVEFSQSKNTYIPRVVCFIPGALS